MDVQRVEQHNDSESERTSSGRWIRDQLREVADSGIAELERSAVQGGPKLEPASEEDQTLLDSLASSISTAVVEPMRNLERSRAAHQHQMEESLAKLSASLEEMQRRFGSLDREVEDAKRGSRRSQASLDEIRPGIAAIETRIKSLEESFGKDLAALGAGLQEVREQVGPLASRLTASEESVARHTAALDSVDRLEQRRRESTRQIASSVESLRVSLTRLSDLDSSEAPEDVDPPAPEFTGGDADNA